MKLTTPIIKEGAKMKKPILTVLFVAMFVASSMLVLQVHSTPDVPTTAYLDIAPNPVGWGQQILGIMWIQADPMPGEPFYDLTVTVTRPDGSTETLGPFNTNDEGVGYFTYVVDQQGTYSFQLHFPGNSFGEWPVVYYSPSDSELYYLVVQEEPVDPNYVPEGYDVLVFPDPEVSLVFDNVTDDGYVQVDKSTTGPPPDVGSLIGPYYYITTTAEFEGNIIVRINYDDTGLTPEQEEALCIIQTDIILGDVNLDGKVNCRDLIAILLALGSHPGHRRWNPSCDLNKDNKVNICDLWIVLKNYRKKSQWTDITLNVDTVNNIIIGQTDHLDQLDPFGIRR